MKIVRRIKAIYRKWKSNWFLKKHNCRTWAHYNYQYDKLINRRADYVGQYYHGYPYVVPMLDHSHLIYKYTDYGMFTEPSGLHAIRDWCTKHCKGKSRVDGLTVFRHNGNVLDWPINPLSEYIYCVAFTNEKDRNWFLLRWS